LSHKTLYSSTKDHLDEFATLRAIGSSGRYIYMVIIWQHCSAPSLICAPLRSRHRRQDDRRICIAIVVTPALTVGLMVLTIVMVSHRALPPSRRSCGSIPHGVHAMTQALIDAVDIVKRLGRGAGESRRSKA